MTTVDWDKIFGDGTVIKSTSSIYKELKAATLHLPPSYLPRQRIWHLINNTEVAPTCKMCNATVRWDAAQRTANQHYRVYCSHKCEHADPVVRFKKSATETALYGVGRQSIVKKMQDTNMNKYGVTHAIKNEDVQHKQRQTNLNRYGVSNVSQSKVIMNKRVDTLIGMYGVVSFAQQHFTPDILLKINSSVWLTEQHVDCGKSVTEMADEAGVGYQVIVRGLKRYDIPITYRSNDSNCERQVRDFVDSLEIVGEYNNRRLIHPHHLDIVCQNEKIAIEVNGIYWHSELNGRGRMYHLNKTAKSMDAGFQLIHVLESDWYSKPAIIKSIIRSKLGKLPTKIYARQCKVVRLDTQDCKTFLINNHLQGAVNSSIRLGLEHNNTLVCVMTFSKARYSKHQYEMYRFCSLLDTNVIGGASKLFRFFVNNYNPKSVVSYSDRSLSVGGLYERLGFTHSHNSSPNYKYFINGTSSLLSRIKFQKHKLNKVLKVYNAELSEWQNMQLNGYDRIWDCGNGVWEWHA